MLYKNFTYYLNFCMIILLFKPLLMFIECGKKYSTIESDIGDGLNSNCWNITAFVATYCSQIINI